MDLGKAFILGKVPGIGGVIPKEAKPLGQPSKHLISNELHRGFTSETSRASIGVTGQGRLISPLWDSHLSAELLHME